MGTTQSPADRLLDDLVVARDRITYKAAYIALIGPPPAHWYHNHVAQIVRVVERSKQVTVDGLTIRLDALVVQDKAPNEPSERHFQGKAYDRRRWQAAFGCWGVRRPPRAQRRTNRL
jgi:hypothetical protein